MTHLDQETGGAYTPERARESAADEVIVLEPTVDAWGNEVWTVESATSPDGLIPTWELAADVAPTPSEGSPLRILGEADSIPAELSDLEAGAGGMLSDPATRKPISVLPQERMATTPDAWAEIVRNLRDAENGRPHQDVEMRPGGALEVQAAGQARPLSRLPQEKMAGTKNPEPSAEDVQEVMRIDPKRVEQWTPVTTGLLNGWKFRLRPAPGEQEFVFLAFRSPSDGNRFRVFVIKPDVDDRFGHHDHMIKTTVGGHSIPVLCGPGGRAADTLAQARLFAGKWMSYTYRRSTLGVAPGFSE
jgi:hypothetical protein